ncbi:hypothetical protein EW145_g2827 [Phellinidium pouzarii]|uniref:Uncharacterized protein n=1 Tax=Phellinidium pouzarii TaxID=167371 RepID=A0A4S4L9B1_9AGAM|nr:hypothetical protein EW145_g2827 [Phellinidium pouzarii]
MRKMRASQKLSWTYEANILFSDCNNATSTLLATASVQYALMNSIAADITYESEELPINENDGNLKYQTWIRYQAKCQRFTVGSKNIKT